MSGETSNTYTPVDGDVGNYLRITVTYNDATFGSDSLSAVTSDRSRGCDSHRAGYTGLR